MSEITWVTVLTVNCWVYQTGVSCQAWLEWHVWGIETGQ